MYSILHHRNFKKMKVIITTRAPKGSGSGGAEVNSYPILTYAGLASFEPKSLTGQHYLGLYPTVKGKGQAKVRLGKKKKKKKFL